MARKADVRVLAPFAWNQYASRQADEALPAIYTHALDTSAAARQWYWKSIAGKRRMSLGVRAVGVGLLLGGAIAPILAGLSSSVEVRLWCAQAGVALLVSAGLMQAADKIFGWSSGWLRYISTVTAMESLTRQFELDWADYAVRKTGGLGETDKKPLFEMVRRLEQEIMRLQTEETEKWVVEFNAGSAFLDSMIKAHREAVEKAADATRAANDERESAAKKAAVPGALELTLLHPAAVEPVRIKLDEQGEELFTGSSWSRANVAAGIHRIVITTAKGSVVEKLVPIEPGKIARLEVKVSP